MAGYREHSFDPNAYEQPGPPLRPFNWVQWTGFALAMAGLAIYLVYFAGRLGWMTPLLDGTTLALVLTIAGVVLINSRRQPGTLVGSEQLARNRRVLLITVVICVALIGVAAIFDLQGAS